MDLAANGFYPGDMIMISQKQSAHNLVWNQIYYSPLWGLFSSSPELYSDNWLYTPNAGDLKWPMVGPLNRVPGAIDAALGGYEHGPWDDSNVLKQGMEVENDIPEDFQIRGHLEFNEGSNGVEWTPNTWVFSNGFWIRIPPGAKYLFIQRVGYWFLNHVGYIKITIDKDSDGDAIPDSWEKRYIDFNKDGNPDIVLKDANFEHKDIYVEIDHMASSAGCSGHEPDAGALSDVIKAFRESPVSNPDGAGVTLHLEVDEADDLPHQAAIKGFEDFDSLKTVYFGTESQRNDQNAKWILLAKKYTYHYCIFIHSQSELDPDSGLWSPTTTSGFAECPGNDFMVSLGGWTTNPGTRDQQAATFMHELGHNLGLDHGGGDDVNYKPNYLSIMNYLFMFNNEIVSRPLDFSRKELATIEEGALDEANGLGIDHVNTYSTPWYLTAFSCWENATVPSEQVQITYLMPIDYNNDSRIDLDVIANVNNYPYWDFISPSGETLTDWDDWANLNFYFPLCGGFADGQHQNLPDQEITCETAQMIQDTFAQYEPLPIRLLIQLILIQQQILLDRL